MKFYFMLGDRPSMFLRGRWYLAAALNCRVLSPSQDQLVISRHVQPPGPDVLRVNVYNTPSLEPFRLREWPGRPVGGDPVFSKRPPLGTVDLPPSWAPGRHPFAFPEPFQGCDEIVMPVSFKGASRWTAIQKLCVARPSQGEVEVINLPWWEAMGYGRVILLLARDSATGDFVAQAIGTTPFLMNPKGEFAGWLSKRDKAA